MTAAPDSSAVRVALWRALHVEIDSPPHVLEDRIGLRLADPAEGWRDRGDMHPQGTSRYRASIVARSRFVEDLVFAEAARGVGQYVILGAGLDTFAQRHPDAGLTVFEIDQPEPQAWKRRRLSELGLSIPEWLRLVPVDFERGPSWWDLLRGAGFDEGKPAVVVSTGVSMYLTKEANAATLRRLACLAPGSTVAMTFAPPVELLEPGDQEGRRQVEAGARAAGTPWLSAFNPDEIVALARECGFREARHVSADTLNERYFTGRDDRLRTSNGEEFLLANP